MAGLGAFMAESLCGYIVSILWRCRVAFATRCLHSCEVLPSWLDAFVAVLYTRVIVTDMSVV